MEVLTQMQLNAKAYNKVLGLTVKAMDVVELLNNTHPIDREQFAYRLFKQGYIDEKTYKLYKKQGNVEV